MRMSNCNLCLWLLLIFNIVFLILNFQIKKLEFSKNNFIEQKTELQIQTPTPNTSEFELKNYNKNETTISFMAEIYVITPTYEHWSEKAELIRVLQAFRLSRVRILWLIVEDRETGNSQKLQNFQKEVHQKDNNSSDTHTENIDSNIHVVLLNAKTPNGTKHRGVMQRNAALNYLAEKIDSSKLNTSAPVYRKLDGNYKK